MRGKLSRGELKTMTKHRVADHEGRRVPESERGEIILYQSGTRGPGVEVRLQAATVWLSLRQMADLFGRDQSAISRHLHNIFSSNELQRHSVVALFATTASDGKTYQVQYFNLDAIISVGYRVNSKRGTQFRIWATNVLKQHIVQGYTENKRRLQELRQSLQLVERVLDRHEVTTDEAKALLRVVTDYSSALDLLDDYDHQRIPEVPVSRRKVAAVSYEEALRIIGRLRERFGASAVFGQEKDESLHSSLNAILQTFGGRDVYPGLEAKAAHLLYFLVKNHSFVDGNKRIAASLFLWFMEKNRLLYGAGGEKRIADATLVALTLMIAESAPREKDPIIKIVMHLMSERR